MSGKLKVAFAVVLIFLAVALTGGLVLMAINVALGTFFFGAAIMFSPFVGIALLLAAYFLRPSANGSQSIVERGAEKASKSLFALAGMLIITSLLVAAGTPTGLIPPVSLPTYLVGTALGVGAVLLVSPMSRFGGPFSILHRWV